MPREPSLGEPIANTTSLSSPRKQLNLLSPNYLQEKELSIHEASLKMMRSGKLSPASGWIMLRNSTGQANLLSDLGKCCGAQSP